MGMAFPPEAPSFRSFEDVLPALRRVCPSGRDLLGNHADASVIASVHAVSSAAHGSAGGPGLPGRSRGGGKDGASGGRAISSGGRPGASGGEGENSGGRVGPSTSVPPAPSPSIPITAAVLDQFQSTGLAVVRALRGSVLELGDYVRPICIQGVNVHVWLSSSGDLDYPMVKVPPKVLRAFKPDVQDKCRALMRAGSSQYFVSSILGQQVRLPPSHRAARTNAAVSGSRSNGNGGSGHVRPHRLHGHMSTFQGQSGVGMLEGTPSSQGQLGSASLPGVYPGSGPQWPQNHHGQWPPPQHGQWSPSHHGPWHHNQLGPWPFPRSGHQLTPSHSDDGLRERHQVVSGFTALDGSTSPSSPSAVGGPMPPSFLLHSGGLRERHPVSSRSSALDGSTSPSSLFALGGSIAPSSSLHSGGLCERHIGSSCSNASDGSTSPSSASPSWRSLFLWIGRFPVLRHFKPVALCLWALTL